MRCGFCGTSAAIPKELLPPPVKQVVFRVDPSATSAMKGVAGVSAGCILGVIGIVIAVVVGLGIIISSVVDSATSSIISNPVVEVSTRAANASPTPRPSATPKPSPTPSYAATLLSFGSEGITAGKFTDARSVAIDGKGNIYVGEYSGGRIQVFDPQGNFLSQFFAGDKNTLLLGMAVDRNGVVYVADGRNITRYEGLTGESLGKITYLDPRFGELAVTPDGGLAAMWYERRNGIFTSREGAREDLVIFDKNGKVKVTLSAPISDQTERVELDNAPIVDGRGNIYILATYGGAIFKFDSMGKFVTRIGSSGNQPGQWSRPSAFASDSLGQLYVASGRTVLIFGADGNYLRSFDVEKSIDSMVFTDNDELITVSRTVVTKFALGR